MQTSHLQTEDRVSRHFRYFDNIYILKPIIFIMCE